MRTRRPLDEILANRARTRIVRELLCFPLDGATGRELARRAEISHAQAGKALKALERAGVVRRRSAGRADLWRVENDNALVPTLRGLFEVEDGLVEELFRDLRTGLEGLPVQRAVLFGSVARGEEAADSDIDLFVEVARNADVEGVRDRLWELTLRLRSKYGLWLSPLVYPPEKLRNPPNPELVSAIARDGLVVLGR